MMYASKIKIDYNPLKVRYQREIKLPNRDLTIDDINKHLGVDETFQFEINEDEQDIYLVISGYRYETEEELKKRIEKQEKYNENYKKHKEKYGL